MLPPRLPKKHKRDSRWRSPAHLNFVRSHGCSIVGCGDLPIEAAHVRLGSHTGMGQKPDDWRAVSLCKRHHAMQHSIGEASFWLKYQEGWAANRTPDTIDRLIEAFAKASPRAAEIARVKKEREDG